LDSVVSRRPFAWRSQCLENRFMTLGSLGSLRLRIDVHPNRQPLDGRLVETLAEFAPQARIELARDAGLRIETREDDANHRVPPEPADNVGLARAHGERVEGGSPEQRRPRSQPAVGFDA